MAKLRGVGVGAGYFSQFHYEAWARLPGAEIVAVCDPDGARAAAACLAHVIPRHYADHHRMFATECPDFVDVIAPPATHAEIMQAAAERGIHVICQKPLAPTFAE